MGHWTISKVKLDCGHFFMEAWGLTDINQMQNIWINSTRYFLLHMKTRSNKTFSVNWILSFKKQVLQSIVRELNFVLQKTKRWSKQFAHVITIKNNLENKADFYSYCIQAEQSTYKDWHFQMLYEMQKILSLFVFLLHVTCFAWLDTKLKYIWILWNILYSLALHRNKWISCLNFSNNFDKENCLNKLVWPGDNWCKDVFIKVGSRFLLISFFLLFYHTES